jgi:hypothetical protein
MAFFPGLPVILSMFLQLGIPVAISGVVLHWSARSSQRSRPGQAGRAVGCDRVAVRPDRGVYGRPYTESLFCAAAFWAWERARSDRWLSAAALAAIACTVRVSGLFLVGALFIMAITTWRLDWRSRFGALPCWPFRSR